jgi:hypothetical protein
MNGRVDGWMGCIVLFGLTTLLSLVRWDQGVLDVLVLVLVL